VIDSTALREQIHHHFQQMKYRADTYDAARQALYQSLKLEGILDAPLNVCITCDRERMKGHRLGRQSDPMTDLYSTVCAVQKLLARGPCRSVGVGWVSIIDPDTVKQILSIPPQIHLARVSCVGYVSEFRNRPELEDAGLGMPHSAQRTASLSIPGPIVTRRGPPKFVALPAMWTRGDEAAYRLLEMPPSNSRQPEPCKCSRLVRPSS